MAMSRAQFDGLQALMERGHRLGYATLSADEQVVYHIMNLETEVSMTGLPGYFHAHYGKCVGQAAQALVKIGAEQSAKILRQACALFPGGCAPADTEARRELLVEFTEEQVEELDGLTEAFQARPDDLDAKFQALCDAVIKTDEG